MKRKKPVRLFNGLAGSPLATVTPAENIPVQKPKRGRPRKHANNAAKQKHYRNWKAIQEVLKVSRDNHTDNHARFMTDAPQGKGLLVTGGYSSRKVEQVRAAHKRDENGRKVKPKGVNLNGYKHGSDDDGTGGSSDTSNSFGQYDFNKRKKQFELEEEADDFIGAIETIFLQIHACTCDEFGSEFCKKHAESWERYCTACGEIFKSGSDPLNHVIKRHLKRRGRPKKKPLEFRNTEKPTENPPELQAA